MHNLPLDIDIHPHYITDDVGKKLSIVLPISEFDALLDALLDALVKSAQTVPTTLDTKKEKNGAARFKGLLSNDEADKYLSYLKKTRNEWDRDI